MPGIGGMPGMGGMPGIGGMPGMGGMPGIGGMPGMGGIWLFGGGGMAGKTKSRRSMSHRHALSLLPCPCTDLEPAETRRSEYEVML
eukprot:764485-Hanusia_phi.AAC.5